MPDTIASLANQHCIINGSRLAYGVYGTGEPVILLHGTPSSSYIWRNIVPKLNENGYGNYLFDLLGYGASERPHDANIDTSVSAQVDIVKSFMAFWKLDKAHIVAHDIGGAIAQRFCLFYPQAVKSLTLIDTVSFDSWPSKRTKQQMQAGLENLIKSPALQHQEHFKEWLLSTVENKANFTKHALDGYLALISGTVGQASFFQHQVAHYDGKHTMEISHRLHELSALPVQIIWGENDVWQVTDWAYRLQKAIPNSSLHILPQCGHFAMEDQPEKISDLILAFIQN